MKRRLASLALAALLLGVSACGSSGGDSPSGGSSAGGTTKVTVGVIPIIDVAPIYLGKQKGFFSQRKIDLNLVTAQGGAAIVPGVVSGQYQFGFSNVISLMLAQIQNVPIKSVANGVASTGQAGADFSAVMVKADSPIQSAKDLAGEKVSVNNLKYIGEVAVRASVDKAGGESSQVKWVEMPFAQMPAALDPGQVDAAFVVEPQLAQLKAKGARPVAWDYVDPAPNLTIANYFTSTKLTQENPDLVKRFTEAINESLAYADAHGDEVRQVVGTYTKIDQPTLAAMTLPEWPTEINRASVEKVAELGQADGVFPKAPDLDKLVP
jgi:NitT/TauT family transport system substrate-binding protein